MLVVIYVDVQKEYNKNAFKKVSINSENEVGDRQKLGDGMGYTGGGRVKETMLYDVESRE